MAQTRGVGREAIVGGATGLFASIMASLGTGDWGNGWGNPAWWLIFIGISALLLGVYAAAGGFKN